MAKSVLDALKATRCADLTAAIEAVSANMFKIKELKGREILDSRGNPTVEVDLITEGGITVTAAVPSGASTGVHEACELRDGDKGRYLGKGVTKAVESVNTVLNAELKGFDVSKQKELDDKMIALDGTPNKSKLGANAILGVSMAAAKAAAQARGVPLYQHFADLAGNGAKLTLPVPCFNVINGGSHAGNKLAFQEYFIIPVGASSFKDAMRIGSECYHTLKGIIKKKFGGDATLIGDEGGFAPPCDARQGVELIMEAIEKAGYKDKCKVGMDVAASEFKVEGQDCYDLGTWYPDAEKTPDLKMTGEQLANFYADLCNKYPLITIEDPFDQDDWAAWTTFTTKVRGHSEEPLPDAWYEAFESARQFLDRRLVEKKPLPATLPDGGDPSEVNIFVIGDWGTYPGTGINMGRAWTTAMWNSNCFQGSSSPEAWKKAKAEKLISASEVVKSWGAGYPICGSMHLECSWGKGGVSNSDRCNPDKDWYWRDHFAQQNVATSMTDLAKERKPSFVINTADNFYYAGVKSTQDKLWSMMFEELYPDQSLQIQWLSSLGNHDYGGHTCDVCLFKASGQETRRDKPCSQAMIDYDTEHDWQWPKNKEVRWVLPMKGNDRWYMKSFVFKKANVSLDVFVIDTNKAHISSQCSSSCPARQDCIKFFMQLWERQKAWLLPALEQSKADWKFVVGHAPPENFEESLMEQMRDRGVSVYMAGHVHQLRHDQCPSGIEAIISGSGGVYQSAGGGSPYTIHETQDYGFATINVKWNKLSVEYWNDQGKRLWDPVVIPKVDLQQEGLLKKLREAALKSDLQAMKDAIAAAKNYGVEDRHVYTAAVAGVKAFEAEGGLAWVFMSPKIMKNDAGRTSGILASWTTEDRLPTTETRLVVASTCCSGATKSQYKDESVLCDPQEKCSPQKMAENLVDGGAAAMLLMSTDQILVDANNNSTKAFALPALSIPKDFVLHVPSWLSNKEEVISISYTGGEKGSQDAIEQARNAGVPEDMIEEATLASRQRRAIEHLKTAMESDDDQELRKAIDLADKSRAQNEIVELAKRRLTLKELEVGLANVNKNCDDFLRVHDMIERADAMHLSNTTAAQECRLSLALEALQYALNEGANCKEPMEKAVAWCKLANALEQKILAAEEFCKKQVGEQGMNSVIIWLVVFLILAIGVGGFWWLQNRKSMQASSATTGRPDGAGIELLDAS